MLLKLISVILGRGQCEAWRNDTFDAAACQNSLRKMSDVLRPSYSRWVIGKVEEECNFLQTAVFLKVASKEPSRFQVHSHGGEDNGEVLLVTVMNTFVRDTLSLHQTSLATNLGCNLVVVKTGSREDGNLLPACNRVHRVDSRNSSRDHFFGVHL